MDSNFKTCHKCLIPKSGVDFYKNPLSKDKLQSTCKTCHKLSVANSRKNFLHKERWAVYQWRSRIRKEYGIQPEDYFSMLSSQEGKCAICWSSDYKGHGVRMAVDHDPLTMKVRGLLCCNCNNGIGRFHHDVSKLQNAIDYLKRSS